MLRRGPREWILQKLPSLSRAVQCGGAASQYPGGFTGNPETVLRSLTKGAASEHCFHLRVIWRSYAADAAKSRAIGAPARSVRTGTAGASGNVVWWPWMVKVSSFHTESRRPTLH